MPTPPLKPVAPPPPPGTAASSGTGGEGKEIVVIPEGYYGAALKMQPPFPSDDDDQPSAEPKLPAPVPPPPPVPPVPAPPSVEHHSRLWLIGLVVFVVLAVGGGWVAWNRDALFAPKRVVPIIPPKPAAPNAPSDLAARSSSPGTASLEWSDRSETENGFRVERKTALDADFAVLQTLPAGSRAFLDQTAPPGGRVSYRVVAFNAGGDSDPSGVAEVAVADVPPAPPVAPTLPPDGLDSDSDGLTDSEEGVYGSNPHLPDSDADGYLDGNEVFNLYSPVLRAPATFLSQPTMQVVSSTVGWQTLVPAGWTILPATSSTEVRVQTGSGETFLFRIEENASMQAIRPWLVERKGFRDGQIIELQSNKYHVPFFLGPDRLTAYVPWNDQVLTVAYQLGAQSFVNFRTSFGLMLNALRLAGSPKVPDLSSPSMIPAAFQTIPAAGAVTPSVATSSVPVPSSTVPLAPIPGPTSTAIRP